MPTKMWGVYTCTNLCTNQQLGYEGIAKYTYLYLALGQICYFIARVLSYDIDQKNMIAENSFRSMMLVRSNNTIA